MIGELAEDKCLAEMAADGKVNTCGILLDEYDESIDAGFLAEKIHEHMSAPRKLKVRRKKVFVDYTNEALLNSVSEEHVYNGRRYKGLEKITHYEIVGSSVSLFLVDKIEEIWSWIGKYLNDEVRDRMSCKKEDVDHRIFVKKLYSSGLRPYTGKMIFHLQKKAGDEVSIFENGLVKKGGGASESGRQLMIGVADRISRVAQEFIFIHGDLTNVYLSTEDNLRIVYSIEKEEKITLIAEENRGPQALICQILGIFHLPHPETLGGRALRKIILKQIKGKRCFPMKEGTETGEKIVFENAIRDGEFHLLWIDFVKDKTCSIEIALFVLLTLILKLKEFGLDTDCKYFADQIKGVLREKKFTQSEGIYQLIHQALLEGEVDSLVLFLNMQAYLHKLKKGEKKSYLGIEKAIVGLTNDRNKQVWKLTFHGKSLIIPYLLEAEFKKNGFLLDCFKKFPVSSFKYGIVPSNISIPNWFHQVRSWIEIVPNLAYLASSRTTAFTYFASSLFKFLEKGDRKWIADDLGRNSPFSPQFLKRIRQRISESCFLYALSMEMFAQGQGQIACMLLKKIPISERGELGPEHLGFIVLYSSQEALEEIAAVFESPLREEKKLEWMKAASPHFEHFSEMELEKLIVIANTEYLRPRSNAAWLKWVKELTRYCRTEKAMDSLYNLVTEKKVKLTKVKSEVKDLWLHLFSVNETIRPQLVIKAEGLHIINQDHPEIVKNIFSHCLSSCDLPTQKIVVKSYTKNDMTEKERRRIEQWYQGRVADENPETFWNEVNSSRILTEKQKQGILFLIYQKHQCYLLFFRKIDLDLVEDSSLRIIPFADCLKGLEKNRKKDLVLAKVIEILKRNGMLSIPEAVEFMHQQFHLALKQGNKGKALQFLENLSIREEKLLRQLIELDAIDYCQRMHDKVWKEKRDEPYTLDAFIDEVFWGKYVRHQYVELGREIIQNLQFYVKMGRPHFNLYLAATVEDTKIHKEVLLLKFEILCKLHSASDEEWESFSTSLTSCRTIQDREGIKFIETLWGLFLKRASSEGLLKDHPKSFSCLLRCLMTTLRHLYPSLFLKLFDFPKVLERIKTIEPSIEHMFTIGSSIMTFEAVFKQEKDPRRRHDLLMRYVHPRMFGEFEDISLIGTKPDDECKNLRFQLVNMQCQCYLIYLDTCIELENSEGINFALGKLDKVILQMFKWQGNEQFYEDLFDVFIKLKKPSRQAGNILTMVLFSYGITRHEKNPWPKTEKLARLFQKANYDLKVGTDISDKNFFTTIGEFVGEVLKIKGELNPQLSLQTSLLISSLLMKQKEKFHEIFVGLMENDGYLNAHPDFFVIPFNTFLKVSKKKHFYNEALRWYLRKKKRVGFPVEIHRMSLAKMLQFDGKHPSPEQMDKINTVLVDMKKQNGAEGAGVFIQECLNTLQKDWVNDLLLKLLDYMIKFPKKVSFEELVQFYLKTAFTAQRKKQGKEIHSFALGCYERTAKLPFKKRERLFESLLADGSGGSLNWAVNLFLINLRFFPLNDKLLNDVEKFSSRIAERIGSNELSTTEVDVLVASLFSLLINIRKKTIGCDEKTKEKIACKLDLIFELFIKLNSDSSLVSINTIEVFVNFLFYSDNKAVNQPFIDMYTKYVTLVNSMDVSLQDQFVRNIVSVYENIEIHLIEDLRVKNYNNSVKERMWKLPVLKNIRENVVKK